MKYLKLFEEIDVDDFDWEEHDEEDDDRFNDYPKEFLEFLKNENILEEYDNSIRAHRGNDGVSKFFIKSSESKYVRMAFSWMDFGGDVDWSEIDVKWRSGGNRSRGGRIMTPPQQPPRYQN